MKEQEMLFFITERADAEYIYTHRTEYIKNREEL